MKRKNTKTLLITAFAFYLGITIFAAGLLIGIIYSNFLIGSITAVVGALMAIISLYVLRKIGKVSGKDSLMNLLPEFLFDLLFW